MPLRLGSTLMAGYPFLNLIKPPTPGGLKIGTRYLRLNLQRLFMCLLPAKLRKPAAEARR
jgi:hypothetical protein